MPVLQFFDQERPLFVHPLRPGRTVIGRSDECDIALPSEDISRIHCAIDHRADGWWLTDRSRHGTLLNGSPVQRCSLQPGSEIGIGPYRARFAEDRQSRNAGATTLQPVAPAVHEDLIEVDGDGVACCAVEISFSSGPLQGQTRRLAQARTRVGGPGSDLVLDASLPSDAFVIRVARGRVMIEPGRAAVFLAGHRVRETTPAWPGEELLIGDHTALIAAHTANDHREDLSEFGDMVGKSSAMRRLFGVLARVAAHDHPVLLTGESGSGKELAARAIHDAGCRGDAAFVAVNCAAVADGLFESELFGHEKGAFTGAVARQDGAFQQADGGTLFLDEVAELKLDAQAKLLRALNSGEVRRVGAAKVEYPDVRIVAATHRNLAQMVDAGLFRADLLFRLAVLTVRIPPLRDRRDDIPLLVHTLLQRQHPHAKITDEGIRALQAYDWPGNVRELRNVLTRAFVMGGPSLSVSSLEFNPWAFEGAMATPATTAPDPERDALSAALLRNGGNRTRAARELGMPRSSLLYKLQRLGIG